MINLNECKFGDRLVTKGGQMVVYLGHAKPPYMISLETEEYHAGSRSRPFMKCASVQ